MKILLEIPAEQRIAFVQEIKDAFKEEIEKAQVKTRLHDSPDNENYLSRTEACKFLNCSKATLHNYQKSGRLPFLKIGRKVLFKKSAIIKALQCFAQAS